MNELEARIHFLVSSLGSSSNLAQRSRTEALRAASLFRQGSTQHALRQSRQVLKDLAQPHLSLEGAWRPIYPMHGEEFAIISYQVPI